MACCNNFQGSNNEGKDTTDSHNSHVQQLASQYRQRTATQQNDQAVDVTRRCILLTSIGDAVKTRKLIERLRKLLDPERSSGDVRSLANEFGLSNIDITYLLSQGGSATEILLQEKSNLTIVELLEKLNSIDREDAAEAVEYYIQNQNCNCADCVIPMELC